MIDLHLHTAASDGALSPVELVARAAAAGLRTISVTDHDTVAGLADARRAAAERGLTFVNGIEITAVEHGRDVHVLGYFFDAGDERLARFLDAQRTDRVRRVREMSARLAALGVAVDVEPLLRQAEGSGCSIGRPHLAGALVSAGHVRTRDEAFERFLDRSSPAFVPRRGASVAEVVAVIAAAGGVSSLAHPVSSGVDALIPSFAQSGLHALEARHSDHDEATERRYRAFAAAHALAVSGGSDFHREGDHHGGSLGAVTLSSEDFAALESRLG
ncbi:MAG TPA: PHP domain-containing protein [Vicinamibacterales bacterium]|nr:PHP domain-containing protein [Vicinamibacterales bacterium]